MTSDATSHRRYGLLLIDLQKAFTEGFWASSFGGAEDVKDIIRTCEATAELFDSARLPEGVPVLCTKCYLDGPSDEPYVDILESALRRFPCIHKPTMDVTLNPRFASWLFKQVEDGLNILVIGGCTTTSCVRVSSQQIVKLVEAANLADKVRVVVDIKLCGARQENYIKHAEQDPVLVRAYGKEFCIGKSAVELAIHQMRQAGVEVLEDGFEW